MARQPGRRGTVRGQLPQRQLHQHRRRCTGSPRSNWAINSTREGSNVMSGDSEYGRRVAFGRLTQHASNHNVMSERGEHVQAPTPA